MEKDGPVMREPKLTAGQGAQTVKSSFKSKQKSLLSPSIASFSLHFLLRLTKCSFV
jgi:hypothetical protein